MDTTPIYGWPFPEAATDPPNGAAQIQALAEAVEGTLEGSYRVARLSRSTNQVIATATDTGITFTDEDFDTGSMINIAGLGGDVIINSPNAAFGGVYLVSATVVLASGLVKLQIVDSTGMVIAETPYPAPGTTRLSVTGIGRLTGTQAFSTVVRQESGSNKNLTSGWMAASLLARV